MRRIASSDLWARALIEAEATKAATLRGTRARISPIHGADLAHATAEAIQSERDWVNIGAPDALTLNDVAALAFESLGKPVRITHLPDVLRRIILRVLPWFAPRRIAGPAQFF